MARIQMAAALLLVAGMIGMAGCEGGAAAAKKEGPDSRQVKSTYGNITDYDQDAWPKKAPPPPPPAPKPAPAPAPAPKLAPAPAPQMAGNCMYLPTGDKMTSALSLCCNMPGEVVAGQAFTYDVQVCNLTGMALNNVVVNYSLNGANITNSDPAMSGGGFAIGDLAPKACKTIKITASASAAGNVKGCMSATWANALCCGTNVVSPALKLVETVSPGEVTKCDIVTYNLTVTNTGTGTATNVKINSPLPNGVKTTDGRTVIDQSVGNLAAGQSQTISFQAMLPKDGTYTTASKAMADNNLSATANSTVIGRQPVLSVTRGCPKEIWMLRDAQYDITITNTGDSRAKSVIVEDTVPSGAKFVKASDGGTLQGGKVVWNLADLEPKASKKLQIVYNLTGEHNAMITTTCTARAACADPANASCQTKIMGAADIGTMITDDNGVVGLGDTHVFRYECKNQGQIDLTNTVMTAELDSGLDFVSSTFPGAKADGQKITFNIGTIKVGQKVMFDIVVKGSKTGELLIKSMTKATETREVRNDEQVNYVPKQ